ncbi:hypothetical protein F5884DRAFT_348750 [Xylogone sp. PMI_703]|nr:hypothetical protein F5884DRAFT_348750 [Xylogone sp. PMI_703]
MTEDTAAATPLKIVILGGSYGGVSTAHYLLKHMIPCLPDKSIYQVVMVSASSKVICRPACPRALISEEMFPQDKLFVDIQKLFESYPKGSYCLINGTATELDHSSRMVSITLANGSSEKINYHALVIATGASAVSPLLGLNRDEKYLLESWSTFREALQAVKSVVIAGGGPAGIETAGELGEFLNGRAGYFRSGLTHPKVPITVVTSSSKILPTLRHSIADKAEDYLSKVGVTIIKDTRITAVEPHTAGTDNLTTKTLVKLENRQVLEADLYIPTTGTIPNTGFIDKALLTADNRVETNTSTLRVDKAGPLVYAVGDASSYARPAIHNILSAIPVLCANMKRDLLLAAGAEESSVSKDRLFIEDKRETQLVPIGKSKGVGSVMGYRVPSFLVWLIKGRDYWLWTTGDLWSGKQWVKEA